MPAGGESGNYTVQLAGGTAAPATLSGAKVSNLGGNIIVTGEANIAAELGMAIGSQLNVEQDAKLAMIGDYTAMGGSRDMHVGQNATLQFDGEGTISNGATLNLEAGSELVVNGKARGKRSFELIES